MGQMWTKPAPNVNSYVLTHVYHVCGCALKQHILLFLMDFEDPGGYCIHPGDVYGLSYTTLVTFNEVA